jgi:hypothetical protein
MQVIESTYVQNGSGSRLTTTTDSRSHSNDSKLSKEKKTYFIAFSGSGKREAKKNLLNAK